MKWILSWKGVVVWDLKDIMGRRSVRRYHTEAVSSDVLRRTLEAARWAPSAHNAQPWRFVVLRENHIKWRLAEAMAKAWDRDLQDDGVSSGVRESLVMASLERFTSAPTVIIACLAMEDIDCYPDDRRRGVERTMAIQSVAAAIQNILLVAHMEDLGACWFCAPLFCPDAVREALGIPVEVEPQTLITMGRPAERPEPPQRKALEGIVYYERWR